MSKIDIAQNDVFKIFTNIYCSPRDIYVGNERLHTQYIYIYI